LASDGLEGEESPQRGGFDDQNIRLRGTVGRVGYLDGDLDRPGGHRAPPDALPAEARKRDAAGFAEEQSHGQRNSLLRA
jgi:hypothetical protein